MAQIFGSRDFLRVTLRLLPKVHGEMRDRDDSFSEETANLLSITLLLGAAIEPAEDIAMKVDAICCSKLKDMIGQKLV